MRRRRGRPWSGPWPRWAQNFAPNARSSRSAPRSTSARSATPPARTCPAAVPRRVARLGTTRVPVDLTQGAAADASEIYTGQWDQLLIGMRTSFTVQPLNELYADTGERGILCHLRVDVAPPTRPRSRWSTASPRPPNHGRTDSNRRG